MTFPSKIIENFMSNEIEKLSRNNQTQPPLNVEKKNDWKFLYFFYSLFNTQIIVDDLKPFTFPETDWLTKTVGSFFIKNLNVFVRKCPSFEGINQLRQLFTFQNQDLSMPMIAFLYSANDFKTHSFLTSDDFFDVENDLGVEKSLKICISNVTSSDVFSYEAKNFRTEKIKYPKYIQPSPCMNVSKYPQCSQYCNWHSKYFKEWSKDEFITLMKYASPQRKSSLTGTQSEIEMAKRLFGNNHTMANLNHTIVPFSLILFCYQRSKGFIGDDLGMYAKACNNFFPTPTDQGICLTRNLDINEVIHSDKNYESLFESNLQSSNEYLKEGTYGSKNILVAFTGASFNMRNIEQTNFRTENYEEEVLFKFHQSKEIPHFFEDDKLHLASTSLKLKAGMEYFLDIIPQVTTTTEGFKKMDIHERNCKLENEVEKNSIFKIYTQQNCKYECNIKKAEAICNCIPWDFLHKNDKSLECDIFGRTCFYNTMDNLAKSRSICNQCMKECDYTIYETILTSGKSFILDNGFDTNLFDTRTFGVESTQCIGETVFCEYFWPNGTQFFDKGLDQSHLSMSFESYKVPHSRKASDLVIIHWRILKPQINVVDAKYTFLDKIASFGGKFGIFAQITGCSLLGMMNFLIVLFKLTFLLIKIKTRNYISPNTANN